MLYAINTLKKSNRMRNAQGKSKAVLSVFIVEYKINEILFFWCEYQIYFISFGENISVFTLATHSCYALVKTTEFFTVLEERHREKC